MRQGPAADIDPSGKEVTLVAPEEWPHPEPEMLADGPSKQQVLYGRNLVTETYAYLGPDVADPDMRYAGNGLACGSCHLDAGRKRYGLSFVGVAGAYPRDMARENSDQTLAQRINGCFERSMNGRALPEESAEMQAIIAYIGFLSEQAPAGLDGRGAPALGFMDRAADPVRGAELYLTKCASCHGADGQGKPKDDGAAGYAYPPLWGRDSFNTGAGMHRILKSASFIRANMPFGVSFEAPVLTEEEAFDIAAFINVQSRPEMTGLDRDYPDRTRKPVDAPFPPYADNFSQDQHKFGPWKPIDAARNRGGAQ
ncbi:MAG: c-type cytochrome [Hyphomonas sp.]|uniref:c-type cytochrome n=1 Tax=Hyphomonas sp. TaxID=87 RepID=UPI003528197E